MSDSVFPVKSFAPLAGIYFLPDIMPWVLSVGSHVLHFDGSFCTGVKIDVAEKGEEGLKVQLLVLAFPPYDSPCVVLQERSMSLYVGLQQLWRSWKSRKLIE